jgi:hypothetical protein
MTVINIQFASSRVDAAGVAIPLGSQGANLFDRETISASSRSLTDDVRIFLIPVIVPTSIT